MAYSQSWLEDPDAIRGILVEVYTAAWSGSAWVEVPVYVSNIGYITTDALTVFNPVITGGAQFSETLSLDGSTSMSFGDIQIDNTSGGYDEVLDSTKYVWVNRPIKVYLGDPRWICANLAAIRTTFELVFDGVVADVDSKSRETLNIRVRDKLERLNTPLTEDTLGTYGSWGSGQTNQESIKPLIFGEVFNIEPLYVDPANLEYMFNNGNSELVIELRDNGVPIYTHNGTSVTLNDGNTIYTSTGKIRLGRALAGTLTMSAQGVKNSIDLSSYNSTYSAYCGTGALVSGTYSNNIANLIALIVTQYGKSTTRLSAPDLDLVNLAAFASSNTQSVGTSITDRSNTLTVCQELATSIGAQLFMTRKGQLQLLRLGVPTTDASVTITDRDILHHSLSISNKVEVTAATTLSYCKNWTLQSSLLTMIPEQHKTMFANDTVPKTVEDPTVKTLYKLDALPVVKDTMLIIGSEATTEATRLNNYFKTPRKVYKFTGFPKLMSLKLGQPVVLQHNRFGLSSGVSGQVISLAPNWLTSTIEIEVIV
ncbi:MAG: hypothetical protein QX189_20020 [Methylococcales bacterium]